MIRKAIAAFVASIITLPIAAWVAGAEPFEVRTLLAAVAAAAVNAIGVYAAPRNEYPNPEGTD